MGHDYGLERLLEADSLFVVLLAATHQHGHVGVMHDVVADGAHDGPAELAESASPRHDEGHVLVTCDAHDDLPWFARPCPKFP